MPKYKVNMARTTWLTVNIEADSEDEAIEKAYDVAPPFSAKEGGWGSNGQWAADADEWMPIDEFFASEGYDPAKRGPVVELAGDVPAVSGEEMSRG